MTKRTVSAGLMMAALAFVVTTPSVGAQQADTKPATAPAKAAATVSYVGCLERLSATGSIFVLANIRAAGEKSTVSGTMMSNKSYRLVAASSSVDLQSWAGYEVTVTGSMVPEDAAKPDTVKSAAGEDAKKDQAPSPAAMAESLPKISVTSVKRFGMTCPE